MTKKKSETGPKFMLTGDTSKATAGSPVLELWVVNDEGEVVETLPVPGSAEKTGKVLRRLRGLGPVLMTLPTGKDVVGNVVGVEVSGMARVAFCIGQVKNPSGPGPVEKTRFDAVVLYVLPVDDDGMGELVRVAL
jgi:hypothetical protein